MSWKSTNRPGGTHAAGVVIANGPMRLRAGARCCASYENGNRGGEAVLTTQWVMWGTSKSRHAGWTSSACARDRREHLQTHHQDRVTGTGRHRSTPGDKPLSAARAAFRRHEAIKDSDPPFTFARMVKASARRQGHFSSSQKGAQGRVQMGRRHPRTPQANEADNVRDLIATNTLAPAHFGRQVDAYVNRKHGREEAGLPASVMEGGAAETYGINSSTTSR